jgi:hypothetical protein
VGSRSRQPAEIPGNQKNQPKTRLVFFPANRPASGGSPEGYFGLSRSDVIPRFMRGIDLLPES